MAAKRISYPHPVVGLGDDVEGEVLAFQVEPRIEQGAARFAVSGLGVTNETLSLMVGQAMAEYVVRLHCSQTFFRATWTTTDSNLEISIPASRLAEDVRIAVRVCARVRIPEYRPKGLNPDYGDARFAIEPGDVLAEGQECRVSLDQEYDPLSGTVGSIMQVRLGSFDEGMRVDFGDQKITIEVGQKDFPVYTEVRAGAPAILHSAMVLPVLVEGLGLLGASDGIGDDLLWKSRLTGMLEAGGIDLENGLLLAAQALLQNPLRRSMDEAKRLFEAD